MNNNIEYYNQHAEEVCKLYDDLTFEQVHREWLQFLPQEGAVLDIGAGSGRDARYFASKGLTTYAVEPASDLLEKAKNHSSSKKIQWFQDQLPTISSIFELERQFNLILLSAVWMHLSQSEREESIANTKKLLKDSGIIVLTLRYGNFSDGRTSYKVSEEDIKALAYVNRLDVAYLSELENDQLGRSDVAWQTVVLRK